MKRFLVRFVLCFLAYSASVAFGENIVERKIGESADIFVLRTVAQGGRVVHKSIETSVWKFSTPVIIAFYEEPSAENDHTASTKINAFAFIPVGGMNYEKVEIDSYEAEGGNPQVETVFFASTDKTQDKKLFVIVSWDQNHATVKGKLYATFVYTSPHIPLPQKLSYLPSISAKLSGGCDCWRSDGTSNKARFKTAAEVNAALRQHER